MKLKEIHRTSTFAWSPSLSVPLIATGTVAGALDESFSNDSQLEIWEPNFLDKNEYALGGDAGQPAPKASVTTSSRFNRLAWGYVDSIRPSGVIAAGMENGELGIWDPAKILAREDALVFTSSIHSGPVRGLDFNPLQKNILSSGSTNAEIYIWDLNDTSKPYSPGTRSTKLDETTAIAWNNHVPHILATSSSTGYTVVWDLRGKREMVALAYSGGTGITGGSMHGNATAMGGRRGMSDVSWHPDNATRLVTASEDDTSPIIMSWDLRNARAPEKILTGHEKGVLSLSWCKQDSDLLISCGKDNRVLCWNPQSAEVIGELPPANNWAFQVQWCPRNPDLFATAFFDGTVGIHSLQSTNESVTTTETLPNGVDIFDSPNFGQIGQVNLSLKQPPKWLRRPASTSFGYGGRLVTVGNLPSSQGRQQSTFVHLRTVVTEKNIVERAKKLREAVDKQSLNDFAEEKAKQAVNKPEDSDSWKALLSLFRTNSREELITLFGLSKSGIAAQVVEAAKKVKDSANPATETETEDDVQGTPHEPVVSFVEPEKEEFSREGAESPPQSAGPIASEATPSEFSTSATSDGTKAADIESTTTEHSLFADDVIGTPQTEAAADFFSSMGTLRSAIPAHMQVPHTNYAQDSSVAATAGSRTSSVASDTLKNSTFAIYPNDTSEVDKLLTKALVLGDFESAVTLCIASDRFADAILLAAKAGPELLGRTQRAYFERQTISLPYLRLFQSIVTDDLEDIVQNADLHDWQEIFVILCTFAKNDEFPTLVEQLGQRLEFQGNIIKTSSMENAQAQAHKFRKNATLCYLAATKLEKVVNIWVDEMREEEATLRDHLDKVPLDASRYTIHAQALQTFIEKVTVFREATKYVDNDLKQTSADAEAKSYKLATLYERYYEYANLLASQGLINEAVKCLENTPADYKGTPGSDVEFDVARERLLFAAGAAATPKIAPIQNLDAAPAAPGASLYVQPSHAQTTYTHSSSQPDSTAQPVQPSSYSPYNPPTVISPYAPPNPYGGAPMPYSRPGVPNVSVPPPPPPMRGPARPPSLSALPKRDAGGWNDPPSVVERRGTPSQANGPNKPAAIVAPFPNAPTMPTTPMSPYLASQQPQVLPPPPRAGASTPSGTIPPRGFSSQPPQNSPSGPPQPGQYHPTPAHVGPLQGHPGSSSSSYTSHPPPPGRILSPPQGPPRSMSGAPQFGNSPMGRGTPPPNGPYAAPARAAPPAQVQPSIARPGYGSGPGPGPGTVPPPPFGSYAPPQGVQRPGPPGMQGPPPPIGPPSGPLQRAPPPGMGPSGPLAPPPKAAPPPPKYPPGDRTHIPDLTRPAYELLSEQLNRMKQVTPPSQKRLVDDTERRLNTLFDALNCETLSKPTVEMLMNLIGAMAARNRDAAMNLHVEMLTRGSASDDITVWMAGIKQLIIRL